MYGVLTLLSMLPLLVVGQVAWIYLSEGTALQARGERQSRSTVEIPAMRGTILDRAGRALAVNTARYDLALDPTVVGFAEQQDPFFERLSALTGTPSAVYRQRVQRRSSPQYVRLARRLEASHAETIEAWDVPGVILTPRFARHYNYDATAAHVLGHVNSDGTGLAGLELTYDEYLQGTPGWRAVQRDRHGRIEAFVGGQVVEPKHGQHLVLTIDLVRQTILEEELQRVAAAARSSVTVRGLAEVVGDGVFFGMQAFGRCGKQHMLMHAHPLGITPRQQRRSRGRANGRSHHKAGELPPLLSQAVDVGCGRMIQLQPIIQRLLVCPDGLSRMIIGVHDDDVGGGR